jgi:hypothetical protein
MTSSSHFSQSPPAPSELILRIPRSHLEEYEFMITLERLLAAKLAQGFQVSCETDLASEEQILMFRRMPRDD